MKKMFKRVITLSAAICLSASSLAACTTEQAINTATRAALGAGTALVQAELMASQLETQLEPQLQAEVYREFRAYRDSPELVQYVRNIGEELAKQSARDAELDYQFDVLESDEINAFTIPGGTVFVTTGLLKNLENEAQLAAVLGHEIGHNEGKHAKESLRRALVAQGVVASTVPRDSAILGSIASVTFDLILRGFSRRQEEEADKIGSVLATQLSYDEMGLLGFLENLADEADEVPGPLKIFLTHPAPNERIVELQEFFAQENIRVENPIQDVEQYRTMTAVLN